MDLDHFYSENPVSSWKVVLGDDLHYHYGAGGDKPFEKTVLNLLEFLPANSKILDCGCGWGGPARLMMREGHDVTGVTISKTQAESITDFPVIHADLHTFCPQDEYDAAVFIESYFHLHDPRQVFDNLVSQVKNIVIADLVNPRRLVAKDWAIQLKPKEYIFGELFKVGYVVHKHFARLDYALPTLKYWLNNINKLPEKEVYGHIKKLKLFCEYEISLLQENPSDTMQIFIHAKRR